MSWVWLLPAGVLLAACVTLAVSLRALGREATALQRSLASLARLGVAVDELAHRTAEVERNLRELPRR